MLDSMLKLAGSNLIKAKEKKPDLTNVTFAHTILPNISMPDQSVDVVLSNCVLNLLPDSEKPAVWKEIARVLRKDGRVCVSDVCARKDLPAHAKKDAAMLVGCVAGAALVGDVKNWMVEAGFEGRWLKTF
jgi:arsenite methyltransferase